MNRESRRDGSLEHAGHTTSAHTKSLALRLRSEFLVGTGNSAGGIPAPRKEKLIIDMGLEDEVLP
jgi:hypothetical protein